MGAWVGKRERESVVVVMIIFARKQLPTGCSTMHEKRGAHARRRTQAEPVLPVAASGRTRRPRRRAANRRSQAREKPLPEAGGQTRKNGEAGMAHPLTSGGIRPYRSRNGRRKPQLHGCVHASRLETIVKSPVLPLPKSLTAHAALEKVFADPEQGNRRGHTTYAALEKCEYGDLDARPRT